MMAMDFLNLILMAAPQVGLCPLGIKSALSTISIIRLESRDLSALGKRSQTSWNIWVRRLERSLITTLDSFRPADGWQASRVVKSRQPCPPSMRWVGLGPRGCYQHLRGPVRGYKFPRKEIIAYLSILRLWPALLAHLLGLANIGHQTRPVYLPHIAKPLTFYLSFVYQLAYASWRISAHFGGFCCSNPISHDDSRMDFSLMPCSRPNAYSAAMQL
jgi:hypothetical protein